MQNLISRELEKCYLWKNVYIKPRMTDQALISLKRALYKKAHFVRTIIVSKGNDLVQDDILSEKGFNLITSFHTLTALIVHSKVTIGQLLKFVSVFQNEENIVKCHFCGKSFGKSLKFTTISQLNLNIEKLLK